MTDYDTNPFANDPERKDCQRHDDNEEVVLTPGYKERENVEDWTHKTPKQYDNNRYNEKDSRFMTYFMAATLAGVALFCGIKEGCRRDDAYEKAKQRQIQEKYNPKGLQKKIQEERE